MEVDHKALIGIMSASDLDSLDEVRVSFLDWRPRATKCVVHSTFAAETQSASQALGMGQYVRAYYLDVLLGGTARSAGVSVADFSESQMRCLVYTDCRSLYDNLKTDGRVPEDKWTAINRHLMGIKVPPLLPQSQKHLFQ